MKSNESLKNIKMLVLDVDGIMTDCKIWLDTDGEWKRFFCIRDGVGIRALIDKGFKVAVITGSKSLDIQKRVKHLGFHYFYEGASDKTPSFEDLILKSGVSPEQMAYMGDDVFDIPLLKRVGFAATVPEAVSVVHKAVHYVTKNHGGDGAVREVCDMILEAQGLGFVG